MKSGELGVFPALVLLLASAGVLQAAVFHWAADFNDSTAPGSTQSGFTAIPEPNLVYTLSGTLPETGGGNSINYSISSATTMDVFLRNLPNTAAATNLYRDGLQNRSTPFAPMTLTLSDLNAGEQYGLRLWFYDYSFNNNQVQYYSNLTSGAASYLGALTNHTGNSFVPTGLYDSRYSLSVTLTANQSGQIMVSFFNAAAASKINGFELTQSPQVPEPVTMGQLIIGGLLVASLRRWRLGKSDVQALDYVIRHR